MKDTIYLIADRRGIQGLRKSLVDVRRGEVCIKLNVEVAEKAFTPPVLTQDVVVNDWRDGIDLEDVQFKQNVITDEEAGIIRQKRLNKMSQILEEQGYEVTPLSEDE